MSLSSSFENFDEKSPILQYRTPITTVITNIPATIRILSINLFHSKIYGKAQFIRKSSLEQCCHKLLSLASTWVCSIFNFQILSDIKYTSYNVQESAKKRNVWKWRWESRAKRSKSTNQMITGSIVNVIKLAIWRQEQETTKKKKVRKKVRIELFWPYLRIRVKEIESDIAPTFYLLEISQPQIWQRNC